MPTLKELRALARRTFGRGTRVNKQKRGELLTEILICRGQLEYFIAAAETPGAAKLLAAEMLQSFLVSRAHARKEFAQRSRRISGLPTEAR